jgi:type VI protein secretion system component VasF
MNHEDMVRQTYSMVLEMYREFPALKGELLRTVNRVEKLETKADDTGRHELDELKQQLADRKHRRADDLTWWARNWITVAVAIAMMALSTGCSIGGALLLRKVFGV